MDGRTSMKRRRITALGAGIRTTIAIGMKIVSRNDKTPQNRRIFSENEDFLCVLSKTGPHQGVCYDIDSSFNLTFCFGVGL